MVATKINNNKDATANPLSMAKLVHRPGGGVRAIKSATQADGWLEGYLVTWGNTEDTDLQGEFFTPRTEFCLDWFAERPVLYHHGLDGQAGLRKIGVIKALESDDLGLWVQAQLDLRDRYARAVYDMIKAEEFGWSSGSVDHLVKIADTGEIATWPIIEGSITPTPAQPSKTLVRPLVKGVTDFKSIAPPQVQSNSSVPTTSYTALKAVLTDATDSEFLRELDARVGNENRSRRTKSYNRRKSELRRRSWRSNGEVDETMYDDAVMDEQAENDALIAALEEEMVQEENTKMARYKRNRTRRSYRRAYRQNDTDALAQEAVEEIANDMEAQLAEQMEEVAGEMAEEIAADLENEAKAFARRAKRLGRSQLRRAYRQAVPTDDIEADIDDPTYAVGGQGGNEHLGDPSYSNPPVENFKRARRNAIRRRRGFRANEEDDVRANGDLDEIQQEEDAILLEEVAEKAYRNGYRRGVRRAFRTTDEVGEGDAVTIQEDNPETGNYDELSETGGDMTVASMRRRRNGRRGMRRGYRRAYRGEDEESTQAGDEEEAVAAFRRGYRKAVRRARRANGNDELMQVEDEILADDPYMQDDELMADPYMQDEEPYAQDDEILADDPYMQDEDEAAASFRRGHRSSSRSRRNFRGKSYGNGYGSYDFDSQARYWRNRAMKAENMEAPGARTFGARVTRDSADQPGAYSNAFKSYLRTGFNMLSQQEQYVLKGKGRVNWGKVKGTFAAPGADPRIKTYFGGSDASAGFAVPPDWVSELNKNVMTQTVMAPECRTRTTTSDRIVQPTIVTTDARRSHAAQVRWPGEVIGGTSEHRTVEDSYAQVDVPIHVMLMSLTAGNSALEDVTFSLEDEINEAFSEAVAVAYDTLIWGGDGQGKIQGIVVNSQVIGSRSNNMQTVSGYIPSGSPDGIVTADVLKEMLFHLPRGYRQRAKWYMNSNTGLQIATLKDGEGNYLIDQREESLQSVGVPDRLLGKPIVYNEFADDIASDAFPILLADLSRGYLIGKRVDFAIRRFDDSAYAELDQVLFLGRARVGGQVLQPAAIKALKVSAS